MVFDLFALCSQHVYRPHTGMHAGRKKKDGLNAFLSSVFCHNNKSPTWTMEIVIAAECLQTEHAFCRELVEELPDRLDMKWCEVHIQWVRYLFIHAFYREAGRPGRECYRSTLADYEGRRQKMQSVARSCFQGDRTVWRQFLPRPIIEHSEEMYKLMINRLSKVKAAEMPVLLKLVYERLVWTNPLNVFVFYGHAWTNIDWLLQLQLARDQKDAKAVASLLRSFNVREKMLLKAVLLMHRRSKQVKFFYDMKSTTLAKMRRARSMEQKLQTAMHTSVIFCRFCYAVLTCVNIKNRPPNYVYYLYEDTLEPRCGRCHSNRLVKIPLFDPRHGIAMYIQQPDFPTIRTCNNSDCYNLTAFPSQLCGNHNVQ